MESKEMFRKLAKLAVRRGVNVQKGQPLIIKASVRDEEFVEMCVKEAYEAGASYVQVEWSSQTISKLDYQYQDDKELARIPQDLYDRQVRFIQYKACFLHILSDQPDGMNDVNPEKISIHQMAFGKKMHDLSKYTMNNEGQWCVIGVPSKEWAHTVFPTLSEEEAYQKLKDAIFMTSRVTEDSDPIENWKKHDAELIAHAKKMTSYQFQALRFTSGLGTDLTVGLVKNHIWMGGGDTTPEGVYFDPNIPTEEVFCMPDCHKTEGKVFAAKPLSYGGTVIEDFWFEFKQGKVVDFGARKGKETLAKMLDFDEGSRRLGEVALVPYDSPISNANILFFNTLYDENAACHLALGACYPENIENGIHMSEEELTQHGANSSVQHVDFMFGTKDMDINGICEDGTEVPVFRKGNFVF